MYIVFIIMEYKNMVKKKKLTQAQQLTLIASQKAQLIRLRAERKARENLIKDGWAPKSS